MASDGSTHATDSAELLRMQNRVLERIANGAPLEETLDLLLRSIDTLAPPVKSSILLLDPDGIHVRHAAAPHLPAGYTHPLDGEAIGEGVGSCGTAAYRREPVITEDIASDPTWDQYREHALKFGLRACWSTPIFDDQRRVLGTFALYWPAPGRPTEEHRKLIENATRTASIAITNHLKNEALECSEERLRLAVKSGHIGIWVWYPETEVFELSDEMSAMLGLTRSAQDNVPMKTVLDCLDAEDRERAEASLRRAFTAGTDYAAEFRVLQGNVPPRWIAVVGSGERDTDEGASRMMGAAIDITERKRAEEEIRSREAQLANAQGLAHFGSYEWDPATNQVHRSAELYRIFGARPEDFAPTLEGYLERVHPDDRERARAIVARSLKEVKPFAHEERIVRPNGEIRVLFSTGQWERDETGAPLRLAGTCQDITERKRADEQLQDANSALQALSARLINAQEEERTRIARELHDDMSQQIAAVSLAVSNLKKGFPGDSAEVQGQSERIQQKLIQLARTVRQLSHELHPSILEHAGLAAALRRYCSELGELSGVRITLRTDGEFEEVPPATALAIYRVAQEALQNAVKHAGVREAQVSLVREPGALLLAVADRGRGMAVDRGGSKGLGLISMKERARLVNGTLQIESRVNEGTTVRLTVPEESGRVSSGGASG